MPHRFTRTYDVHAARRSVMYQGGIPKVDRQPIVGFSTRRTPT
jgi:hypothetical protein